MNLSYIIGKKILFWVFVLFLVLAFMILIKGEQKFLSPAAKFIYKGISLSK